MPSEMDVEQLRTEIWDEIYKSGPRSVSALAENRQIPEQSVLVAVEHDWFEVSEELVSIASQG